jgi:sigma-B regulation protein RsbU (phosphoserine phosphatase)
VPPEKSATFIPLILIVDDDRLIIRILKAILTGAGLRTIEANTLADAARTAAEHQISLVLLDMHLPDGDSLDFCRALSAASDLPVLFISGDNDLTSKTDGFAAGAVDYITKPFAGPEVLARVRTHLRLMAAKLELAAFHSQQLSRIELTQQALMARPENLPQARFSVFMKQILQAGGDFYDVMPLGEQLTDYILADASGHDLGASLWTAVLKALLSQSVSPIETPLGICRIVNKAVRKLLPPGSFFTLLYARLNRMMGTLTLVNAGHPAAILYSKNKQLPALLEQRGDVLGVFDDAMFGELIVPVAQGDRIFLYSDGLVEASGKRRAGLEQLMRFCRETSQHELNTAVHTIVTRMLDDDSPEDDIVLLGIDV